MATQGRHKEHMNMVKRPTQNPPSGPLPPDAPPDAVINEGGR